MITNDGPSSKKRQISTWKVFLGLEGNIPGPLRKFRRYLFVVSMIMIFMSTLALLNAYLQFVNISSYGIDQVGVSSPFLLAGYLGMFISIAFLPIPDYFLIPAYGSLASIGILNPYMTFLVCLIAAVVPIEYVPGRLAGRPLLLKGIYYFGISEKTIGTAEKWLGEHGKFSIFISTFIPYFYTVTSLSAGTLKMKAGEFILSSAAGFGLRYAFLELIGFYGIFIFTSSFDRSQIVLIASVLFFACLYAALYLLGRSRSKRIDISS
jgi:membrane protein DedA with SNARE-associated domain